MLKQVYNSKKQHRKCTTRWRRQIKSGWRVERGLAYGWNCARQTKNRNCKRPADQFCWSWPAKQSNGKRATRKHFWIQLVILWLKRLPFTLKQLWQQVSQGKSPDLYPCPEEFRLYRFLMLQKAWATRLLYARACEVLKTRSSSYWLNCVTKEQHWKSWSS